MMRRCLFTLTLLFILAACAPRSLQRSIYSMRNVADQQVTPNIRTITGEARNRVLGGLQLGGTVVLSEGVYVLNSALLLDADVRIVGAGLDKSFLVLREDATNAAMMRFRGQRLMLSGVSLIYQGNRPAHVLLVENGTVAIESSRFVGGIRRDVDLGNAATGSGLVLTGNTRGLVAGNIFIANQQHGLALSDNATVIVQNNFAVRNGLNGIRLRGKASGNLINNSLRHNGGSGLNYFESSGGNAVGNYSEFNGFFGIRVQGNAAPQLEQNILRSNGIGSLAYYDNSAGRAIANTCSHRNIFVAGTASPRLSNDACLPSQLQTIQGLIQR